jgi:hypothetical protein
MAGQPGPSGLLDTDERGSSSNDGDRKAAAQRIMDAALGFRRASTAVRIPFRDRFRYWAYYIPLAHRGVMVYSADRDAGGTSRS